MKRPSRTDVLLVCSIAVFVCAAAARLVHVPEARGAAPVPEPLAAGDSVPGFWRDLALAEQPAGPTLAVFYTTDCPWGRISVKRLNRLRDEVLQSPGGAVVAVSLSDSVSTASYASETGLALPISRAALGTSARWKVSVVPYTVLLDPSGRVRGAWTGVVDSTKYADIRARLLQTGSAPAGQRVR